MDNKDLDFKDQKIVEVQMEKEVKASFMNYAMSVIMSRALPDVRDGLKPVHRRILYAMYEDRLTYDRPFRKSATTVGNVLGRYHPHGDSAVYDTMVRMAQKFSLRYPLIEGQGNFGNIDGDDAAAYRYTEAKMSRLADDMLADIEKDVVDFSPNFDNKLKEPVVLPARFPNLLVNGSVGIAVGMATNIPPQNLSEVIDGIIHLMDNPDATVDDLMEFIKGPDFPTGALICGTHGIREAYKTGRGRIKVRAKAEIDEDKRKIIFTEIPYQVNKVRLVQSIADCYKEKKIEGITNVCDESGKAGLRVVIDYKRDANPQVILNQLYKYTPLEDTFAVNMLALVDNVPKVLGIKSMLEYYINHQEEVITRRYKFELDKAKKESHILEGYKIAIDNIDEVIEIIKKSESIPDAKLNLTEKFGLTDQQAQAIVDMTLGRLSGLERQKVEERLAKIIATIEEIVGILSDVNKIREIIKAELLEIRRKFGDERRTEITFDMSDIEDEDLIDRHTCVITMTHAGYIKRMCADSYNAQARGGKGIKGITTKEEDFVEHLLAVNSHAYLMLFTNTGKIFVRKAYRIPESSRTSKGTNIVNLLEIAEGEKITAMISVQEFNDDEYLMTVTKKGIVKRTPLKEYEYQRKGGKIALSLDEGDELVYVRHTTGSDEIIIATRNGNAIRFEENAARSMGRTARGVRGIKLRDGDYVAGVALVDDSKTLLTITENGFGKRSLFEEFTSRNRGGLGVYVHGITEKTGLLAGIAAVSEDDDIVIVTNDGITIRISVNEISCYSRMASGVIVMRPSEGAFISSFANVGNDENEIEITDEVVSGEVLEPKSDFFDGTEGVEDESDNADDNTEENSEDI